MIIFSEFGFLAALIDVAFSLIICSVIAYFSRDKSKQILKAFTNKVTGIMFMDVMFFIALFALVGSYDYQLGAHGDYEDMFVIFIYFFSMLKGKCHATK